MSWLQYRPNLLLQVTTRQKQRRCLCDQQKETSPRHRSRAASPVQWFMWIISFIFLISIFWQEPRVQQSQNNLFKFTGNIEESSVSALHKNITNAHSIPQNLHLRLDWTNLQPKLDLTMRMLAHQKNCSAPMGTFVYRNRYGLGSDLHVWGQALCNGMQLGMRLRTVGNWTWMDQVECSQEHSPMLCYFQSSELNCPGDKNEAIQKPGFDSLRSLSGPNGVVQDWCKPIYRDGDRSQVRISAMEFLFLHLSPRVIQEAERQLNLVFHGLREVPKDLITIHIRWGDKDREMELVRIHKYIDATRSILAKRESLEKSQNATANIYLATEDPAAVSQFRKMMPSQWNLYVDQAYTELLPHRIQEYNGSPKMAKALRGRAGLITLGSLLVAMEANDYVLTTESNWSRVMNELRKAIIDPRCNKCTSMEDLRPVRNEW